MSLASKIATGTMAVIALGLLLTKPSGTTALGASAGNAYATGMKVFTAF